MLNHVVLMGRIANDLELKQTQSGHSVISFNVAVDRNFVKQGEERQTDFIGCYAWGQTAEFINTYFRKGRMIAVEGEIRTRNYKDRDNIKHYVTEVEVRNVSFTGEPKEKENGTHANNAPPAKNKSAPAYAKPQESINIGDIDDFEEIISDNGSPF
ncbi:MAG: single-stranded DNA-binding protein [Oscillospiraceae bacterium]